MILAVSADGAAVRTPPGPPIPLTDLLVWYQGDLLTGTDGDQIASWTDSSVNGNNAVQATGAKRPILKTGLNGLNGLNVARFTDQGTHTFDTFLATTFDGSLSTDYTIFYICRPKTIGVGSAYAAVMSCNPATNIYWNIACASDPVQGAGWAGSGGATVLGAVAGIAAGTAFYGRYRKTAVGWDLDGPNSGTYPDVLNPPGACPLNLGSNNYPGTQLDGDIAEVIIYNAALSDGDCAIVKSYLTAKWGL